MKKTFLIILLLCILFSSFGCSTDQPKIEDSTYYVSHTVDDVVFETIDGTWNKDTVHEMITKYHEEEIPSVNVTIKMTFTAKEDFHCATLTAKGGVGTRVNAVSFEYQIYNETLGSSEKDAELLKAGTYTIILESANFCFYEYRTAMLSPYPRDMMKLITELNVIRYN